MQLTSTNKNNLRPICDAGYFYLQTFDNKVCQHRGKNSDGNNADKIA